MASAKDLRAVYNYCYWAKRKYLTTEAGLRTSGRPAMWRGISTC